MEPIVDVVIIGGGIQGLSVASHLAQEGVKDVVLIEQERGFGRGSTERSAGMVMLQVHSGVGEKTQLSRASFPEYLAFKEKYSVDLNLIQCGSVLFATNQESAEQLRDQAKLQNNLDIPTETIDHAQLQELAPFLRVDDITTAVYCPEDGYLNQAAVVEGYRNHARRNGVILSLDTKATGIKLDKNQVVAVETTVGPCATRTVVNAGGALADKIGAWVGLKIPIRKTLRSLWFTTVRSDISKMPIVEDVSTEWYMRPESNQIMIGVGPVDEVTWDLDNLSSFIKPSHREAANDFLSFRAPGFGEVKVEHGWAGIRALTPDQMPILGPVPEVKGFINCCGWSGYGTMHAPIAGQLIAELIVYGETRTMDIKPFLLSRFSLNDGGRNEVHL